MNPLRAAFATLVECRDRFATAAAALAPLMELGGEAEPAGEISPQEVKALPPGRKPRASNGRKPKAPRAKGTRPRIDAEVIAKIEQLSREGMKPAQVAQEVGVSEPTARKYAKPAKKSAAAAASAPAPTTNGGKKVWV